MNPSSRHPLKALAVVIAVFALVHGARAHVFPHAHEDGHTWVHITHDGSFDRDCWNADDADVRDDDREDDPVIDVFDAFDDDAWS